MSMIFSLSSVSDSTLSKVQNLPQLLWHIVDPENADRHMKSAGKMSFFARLFGKKKDEPLPQIPQLVLCGDERIEMCLDKAWHGIHFLLTDSDWQGQWPLNFLLAAGEPVAGIDFGYGEARVYTAAQVREINTALQTVSKETFESHFNPEKMTAEAIYPNI